MNIELLVVGKTDSKEVEALVELYVRRVNRYCRFAVTALPDVRNTRSLTQNQQRTAEGEAILRQLAAGDHVVLLDERGDEMRSVEFAYWLQKGCWAACGGSCWSSADPTASRMRSTPAPTAGCRFRA